MNSRLRGNNHTKSAFAPPSRTAGCRAGEMTVRAAGVGALSGSLGLATSPVPGEVGVIASVLVAWMCAAAGGPLPAARERGEPGAGRMSA